MLLMHDRAYRSHEDHHAVAFETTPGRSGSTHPFAMTAITPRRIAAVLAATKPHPLVALGNELQRRQRTGLVRTIAERLRRTSAAATPPVGTARHDINRIRCSYNGIASSREEV